MIKKMIRIFQFLMLIFQGIKILLIYNFICMVNKINFMRAIFTKCILNPDLREDILIKDSKQNIVLLILIKMKNFTDMTCYIYI